MSTYVGKIQVGNNLYAIGSTLYGICTTGANAPTKVVVLPEFSTMTHGVTVYVRFTEGNTVTSGVTLTVGQTTACNVFGNFVCKPNTVVGFTLDEATGTTSLDGEIIQQISNSNDYYWRVIRSIDITSSTSSGNVSINVNGVDVATGLAPTANPIFTGIVTIPATTSASGDNTAVTKKYVDTAISTGMAGVSSMVFKGTIGTNGDINTSAEPPQTLPKSVYVIGETYYVITAGEYAGQQCEIGDLIIAIKNGPSTAGENVINADWTVAQTNITGAVTTSGSTSGYIAVFNGTHSLTGLVATSSAGTGFLQETGTWATPPDTKVTQVPYTDGTTSVEYNLLFKYTSGDDTTTNSVYYSTITANGNIRKLTFNPATGTLTTKKFNGELNPINLSGANSGSTDLTFLHQTGSWKTLSLSTSSSGNTVVSNATVASGVLTLELSSATLSMSSAT